MFEELLAKLRNTPFIRADGILNSRCNDPNWWVKNGMVDLYDKLILATAFVGSDARMGRRYYHILNNIIQVPVCELAGCETTVTWQPSIGSYSKFCSRRCNATFYAKTGSDNRFSMEETKQKIKKTNLEKYGVDNYSKTTHFSHSQIARHAELSENEKAEIQAKREFTNIEKYGTHTPLLNPEVRQKVKDTLMSNYGVEHALQNPIILDKMISTTQERYDRDHFNQRHLSPEFIAKITDVDWITKQMEDASLKQIADEHGVSYSHLCKLVNATGIDLKNYSSLEVEISDFVRSINSSLEIQQNVKILPDGKEIDIFIPEKNLGIECNGTYWHSENAGKKDKRYHLAKTESASSIGISLMHIMENEWYSPVKKPIIKNLIKSRISGYDEVLYARHCVIESVPKQLERAFLNENHIQGYVPSGNCTGLFYEGNLRMLMSFVKSRYSVKHEWELLRMVSKGGTTVLGGANRLMQHFIKNMTPSSIVTYADRRFFTGNIYANMGFTFTHNSKPNYSYIHFNEGICHSRVKFQKHKLKSMFPESWNPAKTEWMIMQENGYDRIWDCGNATWTWESAKISTSGKPA